MKKLTVLLLTGLMVISLAACGGKNEDNKDNTPDTEMTDVAESEESTEESTQESSEDIANEEENAGTVSEAGSTEDPVAVLNSAWSLLADDQKFPAAGGDFSEENNKMDEPSVYSLEDGEAVDAALGLPQDAIVLVDSAASLMHMMNANTFTGGAFHVADPANVEEVISALDNNISNRQWMCGFPDKLVIIRVDDTVVSMFGKNDPINNMTSKLLEAYPNATVEVEKNLE